MDKTATAELEYDWGRILRLTVIRGAVPGDLLRMEAVEKDGRGAWLEIPLSAAPGLHEALSRAESKSNASLLVT